MKKLLWFGLLLFSVLIVVGWGVSTHWVSLYLSAPPGRPVGNTPAVVNAIKNPNPSSKSFTFIVISDTHLRETSEPLMELAMAKGDASFMMHVGDFTNHPDIWEHRMFYTELAEKIKLDLPIFLTPSNHTLDYSETKVKDPGRRVTPAVFDELYGARNFDFVYQGCLFIIFDGAEYDSYNYMDYLRPTLAQKAAGRKHIFTFCHYPPTWMNPPIKKACLPQSAEFSALMEQYKVTACFFGHHHGYYKQQRNGVDYIVCGGGGHNLEPGEKSEHFFLRITVDGDKVEQEMVTAPTAANFDNWIGENAFMYIVPIFPEGHLVVSFCTILVVLSIITILILWKLAKAIRTDSKQE